MDRRLAGPRAAELEVEVEPDRGCDDGRDRGPPARASKTPNASSSAGSSPGARALRTSPAAATSSSSPMPRRRMSRATRTGAAPSATSANAAASAARGTGEPSTSAAAAPAADGPSMIVEPSATASAPAANQPATKASHGQRRRARPADLPAGGRRGRAPERDPDEVPGQHGTRQARAEGHQSGQRVRDVRRPDQRDDHAEDREPRLSGAHRHDAAERRRGPRARRATASRHRLGPARQGAAVCRSGSVDGEASPSGDDGTPG